MRVSSLQTIFQVLTDTKASYLVVGGIAVMAHGYLRFTNDLDLVLNLSSERLPDALQALSDLGFRPRIPAATLDLANADLRDSWREEKNMVVLSLFSPSHPELVVDIFVTEPFDFEEEYAKAMWYSFGPGITIPIISLARLMEMKRQAGRPHDLLDLKKLATIHSIHNEGT